MSETCILMSVSNNKRKKKTQKNKKQRLEK